MAGRAGHRDRRYGLWWVWLAVAFVVALSVIFVYPFISSPQPEQALRSPPTSITEAETIGNQSQQPSVEPSGQPEEEEEEEEITRPQ
jgi:flagellar basal body-associated protein FliL